MPLIARPFTASEYATWMEHSIAAYAADKVAAGTWLAADAPQRAAASLAAELPAGPATAGHLLRMIVTDDVEAQTIGWFWVGPAINAAPDLAWLYDIEIVSAHRGQGHGRAVMALAEIAARELGYARLGLHVFAHNSAARSLYEKCGYTLTDLSYAKQL